MTAAVRSPIRSRIHLTLLTTWAAAIAWLSLGHPPTVEIDALSWDKLQHAGAYGLLLWLALLSWSDFGTVSPLRVVCAWGAVLAYGGLLEIAQLQLTEHRTAEWWDLVADGVGAALAAVIFWCWRLACRGR